MSKRILLPVLFISVLSLQIMAQTTGELVSDPGSGEKMLIGLFQKSDIAANADFTWYEQSRKIYPRANANAVKALKENKDKIYLIVFAGTWCEDTHFVLPKFFKIQEEAGFPEDRISLIALDRNKQMTNPLARALNIQDVPTIIVMKNGKELGRVVEYGKTGAWDQELAELITGQ